MMNKNRLEIINDNVLDVKIAEEFGDDPVGKEFLNENLAGWLVGKNFFFAPEHSGLVIRQKIDQNVQDDFFFFRLIKQKSQFASERFNQPVFKFDIQFGQRH